MSHARSIRPTVLLGLALGGVLVGHTLTYHVVLPEVDARAAELARSGHGYLAGVNALGLMCAIGALALLFLRRLLRANAANAWHVLGRLLAFQIAAFTAMEALERGAVGPGSERLTSALITGLAVQTVVAAAIAWIVRIASRAAERIASITRVRAVSPSGAIVLATPDGGRPIQLPRGARSCRAPPSLLPA